MRKWQRETNNLVQIATEQSLTIKTDTIMRNMQSTFDLTSFKNLNAPKFDTYSFGNINIPYLNNVYGKVFYMEYEGKITAFKFLAWAMCKHTRYHQKIAYLIQTPMFTKWFIFNDVAIFTSVSDLVSGEGNNFTIPMVWDNEVFANCNPNLNIVNKNTTTDRHWEVVQSYYYSSIRGRVEGTNTKILYLMGTPQGMFFGLEQSGSHKSTPQEVLAERFNGVEIVDFAEPTIIEIKIEIPSTEIVTRRLVLE